MPKLRPERRDGSGTLNSEKTDDESSKRASKSEHRVINIDPSSRRSDSASSSSESIREPKTAKKRVRPPQQQNTGRRNACCLMACAFLVILAIVAIAIGFYLAFQTDDIMRQLDEDTKARQHRIHREFGPVPAQIGGNDPGFTQLPAHTWQIPTLAYRPEHYHVDLHVYLPGYGTEIPKDREFTFIGVVKITVSVSSAQRSIEMHSKGLDLIAATIFEGGDEKKRRRLSIGANETLERISLSDGKPDIKPGKHIIQIVYSGTLSRSMHGLYRSVYYDEDGNKKWIATTQFESTNAREMVPCFDEPRFKATWTFSIRHPVGTTATSNAAIVGQPTSEEHDGLKWQRTNFEPTPPLSTYIIALIVHDFGYDSATVTDRNIKIGVYARKEMMNQTKTALNAALIAVPELERVTGVPYPLKKLDIFAIPDFAAGAMENWGIMTFRESMVLDDPVQHGSSRRIEVEDTVAHEIGHQWFGDLVTPEWWGDLWLNEGFAKFSELVVGRKFGRPTDGWGHQDAVFLSHYRKAMDEDDIMPLKPIVVGKARRGDADYNREPHSYYAIRDMFGKLTYEKAAYGIYTLFTTLGEERFTKMIKAYLLKHTHSNTAWPDIWDEDDQKDELWKLAVQANKDHLLNPGYPRINVERLEGKRYAITTERHCLSGDLKLGDRVNDTWSIPIQYPGQKRLQFMPADGSPLIIESNEFPFINHEQLVFARVNYGELWPEVRKKLHKSGLSGLTRTFIYQDAFALARDGVIPYTVPLDFLNDIHKEPFSEAQQALLFEFSQVRLQITAHIPTRTTMDTLGMITTIYTPSERRLKIADDVAKVSSKSRAAEMGALLETVKWEQNSGAVPPEATAYMEQTMNVCAAGERTSKCSKQSPVLRWLKYVWAVSKSEDPEQTVICAHMWEKLQIETEPAEQEALAAGVAACDNETLVEELFSRHIANDGLTRLQSTTMFAFVRAILEPNHAIQYLIENVNSFWETLSYAPDERKELFENLLGAVNDDERLAEARLLRARPDLPEDLRELPSWDTAFETHRLNRRWRLLYAHDLLSHFERIVAKVLGSDDDDKALNKPDTEPLLPVAAADQEPWTADVDVELDENGAE